MAFKSDSFLNKSVCFNQNGMKPFCIKNGPYGINQEQFHVNKSLN